MARVLAEVHSETLAKGHMAKKRNAQDSTLINIRALKKRVRSLELKFYGVLAALITALVVLVGSTAGVGR